MGMLVGERACQRCYGDGKAPDGLPCWSCHGTGRDLTELGREMIRLLSEHFVLTLKSTLKSALSEDGR